MAGVGTGKPVVINGFGQRATMTVVVKLSGRFRARIWLATKMLAAVVWLLGVGLNIEVEQCE
jgi:hypothetical protein